MWGLESRSPTSRSRSRLLWQSLGLVSKFEPGLGCYGLDYITDLYLAESDGSFVDKLFLYKAFFLEIDISKTLVNQGL